jgi:predicted dithiol-disulfide oxidoreductase (DUF899 family)
MPELKPAVELAALGAAKPYPNDSAEYRRARARLLAEEIELRRHIARVAQMRSELPLGGEALDVRIEDEDGKTLALADLFGQHDTLITYFWMYGPQRKRPCPMCTSFLGSIDQPSRDLTQRVALAILGRSPVSRQLAFARERGWEHLKFYRVGDDFARAYRGLSDKGEEWASLDVWVKRDGKVFHTYGGEMGGETADPGQDPRGAPDVAPLWTLLDLTPAGRGTDWYPKLEYSDK